MMFPSSVQTKWFPDYEKNYGTTPDLDNHSDSWSDTSARNAHYYNGGISTPTSKNGRRFPDHRDLVLHPADYDSQIAEDGKHPFNTASEESFYTGEKQQRSRRTRMAIFFVFLSCLIVSLAIAATVVFTSMLGKKQGVKGGGAVSYTHLTLPTTGDV